jgi:hypothetical protein
MNNRLPLRTWNINTGQSEKEGVKMMEDRKGTDPTTIVWVIVVGVAAILVIGLVLFLKP